MLEGQLGSAAKVAQVFDVAADIVLTRAGEPGDEFFVIIDGTARVDVSAEKHVPLHPGEFFGLACQRRIMNISSHLVG